ncbi:hypothetical protein [Nonomuraea sp. NPDC050783]
MPAGGDLTVWPDAAATPPDDRSFDLWLALGMVCLHEPGRGGR